MPLTHSQRTLDDDLRPDFYAGRKLGEVEQACYGACSKKSRSARVECYSTRPPKGGW